MTFRASTAAASTYRVTIHFLGGRRWSKGGYSLEQALDCKTWFLERVPPAIFGSMEPERRG